LVDDQDLERTVRMVVEVLDVRASRVGSGTAEIDWICWIGALECNEYLGEELFELKPEPRQSH
jgi:hypothetical protein